LSWRGPARGGKFSARGWADRGGVDQASADLGNGRFLPFLAGRSALVAWPLVARLGYRVGRAAFCAARRLIANLATRAAWRVQAGQLGAVRRAEPGGGDPLDPRALVHHPRRARAIGPSAPFLTCQLHPRKKIGSASGRNGVRGAASRAVETLSAKWREGDGAETGRGSKAVFVTGGQVERANLRDGGRHVN
jgi:hypothetical protein